MEMLAKCVPRRGRALYLTGLGIIAGYLEELALAAGGADYDAFLVARAIFAGVLTAGLLLDSGVPYRHLRYALGWAAAGVAGDLVFTPFSAALGRAMLGAGIGAGVAGPGPLHPLPWQSSLKGALGGLLGGFLAHFFGVRGAPHWLLPGLESLGIGLFLIQGRSARLLTALSYELAAIRKGADESLTSRASKTVEIATQIMSEIDEREEATGEDSGAVREEVVRRVRRALGFYRRLVHRGIYEEGLSEKIENRLAEEEESLRSRFRSELEASLGSP